MLPRESLGIRSILSFDSLDKSVMTPLQWSVNP
jgi:hypothetical protein